MAQEKRKRMGPPKNLAAIVAALTPRAFRDALALRLTLNYTSLPDYFIRAARGIRRTTAVKAVEAFDPWRFLGDLCCLYIAFSAAEPAALAAVLSPAIAALMWRDAYSHPPERSYAESATDVLVMAIFTIVWQTVLLLVAPASALPWPYMATQLSIAMCMVSGWRFVFRMEKPPRQPVVQSYRSAWWTNTLWFIGVGGLVVANTRMIPAAGPRDVLLILIPVIVFTIDFLQHSNAMGGVGRPVTIDSIFTNRKKQELVEKQNRLIRTHAEPTPGFSLAKCIEPLFFLIVAFPIGSAVISSLLGRIAPDDVNWMQMAANTAAFTILSGVWIDIKKVNARAALDLQQRIDSFGKGGAA